MSNLAREGKWRAHLFVLVLMISWKPLTCFDSATCIAPLGMESGAIKDEHLSASSSFEHSSVGPHNARIRVDKNGGAWCPRNMIGQDASEWLEIDLQGPHVITGSETMGRFGNGQGAEFSESYILEYYRPRLGRWVRYRNINNEEVLKGNTNTYMAVKYNLVPVVVADKVRFHPYSQHVRTICMRVEVYGCKYHGGVVSYTMPQGDKRGANYEFLDWNYDGEWRGDTLMHGLGSLTDGNLGPTDYKLSYYAKDRGWVGWKRDRRDSVEIIFEFDEIREFHNVQIYCNNQFTHEVAVFREMVASFSVGGKLYVGEGVGFAPPEDKIFEDPRNVTAKLYRRVGRFVKLELFFDSKWILISEVGFDSSPARGNYSEETEAPVVTVEDDNTGEILAGSAEKGVLAESNSAAEEQEINTSKPKEEDVAMMPMIVGALTTVIILLAAIIFFIVSRSRQRKQWGGKTTVIECPSLPNEKMALNPSGEPTALHYAYFQSPETAPIHGSESGGSNSGSRNGSRTTALLDDNYNSPATGFLAGTPRSPRGGFTSRQGSCRTSPAPRRATPLSTPRLHAAGGRHSGTPRRHIITNPLSDQTPLYMEPYQVMRYSPYARCGPSDFAVSKETAILSDTSCGEYALPVNKPSPKTNNSSLTSSKFSGSETSLDQNSDYVFLQDQEEQNHISDSLKLMRARVESLTLFPVDPNTVNLKEKISDGGNFGTVYTGEAAVPSYGQTGSVIDVNRLVAVKHMAAGATHAEQAEFMREVRLLAGLEDENISRVLGVCDSVVPFFVVMEYLEHGDLNNFLRSHLPEDTPYLPAGTRTISLPTLLYMATQIASGMKYLEALNFVHRDLATRNCLVGKAYHIKICDFSSDCEEYRRDYTQMEDGLLLPIRWMAWESIIERRYTTKSDVWSYGVCLWEILNYCSVRPHQEMTDTQLISRLQSKTCPPLPMPRNCHKDLYELMLECWNVAEASRPTFREIHLFLQRKNLGYSPV